MSTGLLIDERPLIVQPSLVKLLGSIERAVVLQQIHWLLQQPHTGEIDEDGNKWVWGTLQEWCSDYFQMWQPPALKKHLRWLREQGYLIVEQRAEDRWKKTNYYRIDYEKIAQIEGNDDNPSMGNDSNPSMGTKRYPSMGNDRYPSYKETETSTETSTESGQPTRDHDPDQPNPNDRNLTLIAPEEPKRPSTASRFLEFWAAYPRKVKKAEALKVWKAKKLDRLADQIIADVKNRQQRDRSWIEGFVPHPTTYLRGERWEDEIEPPTKPNGIGQPWAQDPSAPKRRIPLASEVEL
jgi:DNA-binding transcriptional ArsR family regulator